VSFHGPGWFLPSTPGTELL